MAIQGNTHQITQWEDQARSFESYEALHKYCTAGTSKKCREYSANCNPTATDGGGTAKEVASSTDVTAKGKTGLTLIAACDADTEANRGMRIDIHYYTNAGVKKDAYAILGVDATTETAFKDKATGLVAVDDFYCFNQDDYGVVVGATTYGSCVVCSVALGAATNLCIGITGAVAGIADPEKCYAHVNTTKVYPLLADIYGVGQIWGEREADDSADDTAVETLELCTPWGEIKTATCTNTTTHTDIIRYIYSDGTYVCDFYLERTLKSNKALVKAHHICDHDGATHYAVIEALAYISCHTTFMALDYTTESHIGEIIAGWSSLTGLCTLIVYYTPYGETIENARKFQFYHDTIIRINERLQPLTKVHMTVADDGGDAGTLSVDVNYIEKLV